MPTAQERLKSMLAEYIAPLMKQHGYKRQRNRWGKRLSVPAWRPSRAASRKAADAEWWLIYEVQSSTFSNSDELDVTVNLGAYSSVIAGIVEDRVRWKGMPAAMYGQYCDRIGQLLRPRGDNWWTIDADREPASIGAALRRTTEKYALPHLASITSHKRLLEMYENTRLNFGRPWREWSALILVERGEAECRRWTAKFDALKEYKDTWLRRIDKVCS